MNHHRHHKKATSNSNDTFLGRNFSLKNNLRKSKNFEKQEALCNYSKRDRLESLIIPAASPSSPEIVFNVPPKLAEKRVQDHASTSCFPNFPLETLREESEFKFVTPKSRGENANVCAATSGGATSSTIGDITPSLFDAIYDDITPNTIRNSRKSEAAQPSSSPELSIGSLPSDILSSPENIGSSPPLFASHTVSSDNSGSYSSSPTASPKKKKLKTNERNFDVVDFNLVSQEIKASTEKLVENFDIQSHSRVFAFEFKLNDMSCEIEEMVCVELLKNGNDFQETGIRFHASIIQKADTEGNGKYYLTDALTNLSRLIYSNSFFQNDHSPKIVTRSHGKKMEILLDTLQNIIIGDTFDSYSFLNNLHRLMSDQTIYLYESFKDNIKHLCNEQEILNYFSLSANPLNWMCQICSFNSATACSLVECGVTASLFQKMFPVIEKMRSSQHQPNDSTISINIDYDEAFNAIKTPPNDHTPKSKTAGPLSGKKISKIKISPKGIVSASNNNKEFKKTLQLAIRNSPKKQKPTTSIPSPPEKENETIAFQPVENCPKIQFIPPLRSSLSTSPKTSSSSSKLTILKKNNTLPVQWSDQKVEELLIPKSVAILHYFSTCKQKNLDSFFKSPKGSMIIHMRPFLSIKDLVNKFSEHPCLGLINLVQFCKTSFGV